ncbi:MAG: hypothetical protein PWK00_09140, partial [Coxiella burnetii]|nr:hypothetical protein [Coxiella burnetii]
YKWKKPAKQALEKKTHYLTGSNHLTDIRKYGGQTEMAHCKIAKRKELLLENSTYSVKISFPNELSQTKEN